MVQETNTALEMRILRFGVESLQRTRGLLRLLSPLSEESYHTVLGMEK